MEMTLEQIVELREKGLSWREIGMFFAQDGEEPYLVGERVTCGIIGEDTGLEELWLMRP